MVKVDEVGGMLVEDGLFKEGEDMSSMEDGDERGEQNIRHMNRSIITASEKPARQSTQRSSRQAVRQRFTAAERSINAPRATAGLSQPVEMFVASTSNVE